MTPYYAFIIDDQISNIEVLAMLLSQQGVSYIAATSIGEASNALEHLPHVDVVFLDLELPNGDHRHLLDLMKADPHLEGVPIIAYTVHTSEMDAARREGFDGFLGKPISIAEFPSQLARILNGESVWAS